MKVFLSKTVTENSKKSLDLKKRKIVLTKLKQYNKPIPKPNSSKYENPVDRYERIHKAQPLTYLNYR